MRWMNTKSMTSYMKHRTCYNDTRVSHTFDILHHNDVCSCHVFTIWIIVMQVYVITMLIYKLKGVIYGGSQNKTN
jgi:hypothetical protein